MECVQLCMEHRCTVPLWNVFSFVWNTAARSHYGMCSASYGTPLHGPIMECVQLRMEHRCTVPLWNVFSFVWNTAARSQYGMRSALHGTPLHGPISYPFVCHPNNKKYSHHFNKYKLFEIIRLFSLVNVRYL